MHVFGIIFQLPAALSTTGMYFFTFNVVRLFAGDKHCCLHMQESECFVN